MLSMLYLTGKVTIKPAFDMIPISLEKVCVLINNYTGLLEKLGYDTTNAVHILGKFYGFQDQYTSTHAVVDLVITATNLPDLYYPKFIYVCVDQIRTPNRVRYCIA